MKKILFLAQFAPVDGKYPAPTTPEEKFYAETYHFQIYEILKKSNYSFYSTNDVNHLIMHHEEYDLVWSVYNRLPFKNSEIFIQSLCEFYRIPYIGAAPNIRALIEDKSMSKQLAQHLGINNVIKYQNIKLLSTFHKNSLNMKTTILINLFLLYSF